MIPDNVTLIVKAPNQQIDDQNIDCQTSWTVKQLKGHLAEVYPSKPRTEEQKIIYSGQLLDDNIVLKDILRTYETQIAHTMHLVCTPKRRMADQKQPEQMNEGLRRRVVNETPERPIETASRPETRQNDQNHNVEMQNYLSSFVNNYGRVPPYPANYSSNYLPVPNDPALYANHMLMMHQAYMRYMQQYANMWQAPTPDVTPAPQAVPEAPPQPQPAPDAPVPEDNEEAAPRDWLDHLYAASRLAILFSLVYLYGSPARLLLVLMLAAAGYLHQIGFFRDLHVQNAPINVPPQRNQPEADNQIDNNNQQVDVNRPATNQPDEAVNQPDNHAHRPVDDANRPEAAANRPNNATDRPVDTVTHDNNNDDRQSLLAVTWMIFTSFFASLIPDTN